MPAISTGAQELLVSAIENFGDYTSLAITGGQAGWTYAVQYVENLTSNSWKTIRTIGPLAADGSIELADYSEPLPSERFYRVVGHAPSQD